MTDTMRPWPSTRVALHRATVEAWLVHGMPANDSTREAACEVIATLLDDLVTAWEIVDALVDGGGS